MEKFPGEVTRLSPGNFSPPTFQTGRFPGENDVSPVKLPGEEFGLKGVIDYKLSLVHHSFLKLNCPVFYEHFSEKRANQPPSPLLNEHSASLLLCTGAAKNPYIYEYIFKCLSINLNVHFNTSCCLILAMGFPFGELDELHVGVIFCSENQF